MQIALQVREYLLKGVIQNAVNVPSISEEEYQADAAVHRAGRAPGRLPGAIQRRWRGRDGPQLQRRDRRVEDGAYPQCCRGRRAQPDRPCSRAGEPGERGVDCRGAGHPADRAQEDARRRRRCRQRAAHDLQERSAGKHGGWLRSAWRPAADCWKSTAFMWKRRWKAT